MIIKCTDEQIIIIIIIIRPTGHTCTLAHIHIHIYTHLGSNSLGFMLGAR